MKKAIGQTVRDLKRELNKKVLKVPGIEQKVLDATSNEAWGPHGSLLADIAQATRNYHEYQLIMAVIWKRINDTGKNWRHVYKRTLSCSRDGYKDGEYRGRSQSVDDYQYGSRSQSSDKDHNRSYEDDGQHSSRYEPISE